MTHCEWGPSKTDCNLQSAILASIVQFICLVESWAQLTTISNKISIIHTIANLDFLNKNSKRQFTYEC